MHSKQVIKKTCCDITGKFNRIIFLNILRNKEYANNVNNQSFRLIAFAVKGLTEAGR